MKATEQRPPEDAEGEEDVIEHVADDVRDEIRQGHLADDVGRVLEERLHDVGVDLRPERIDDLAEHIETDVST